MKTEEAKQLSDNALTTLAEALEAGQSEPMQVYLRTMARFHRYSFGNVLMIAFQRPDATQVAGFQTWKKLGRCVRKGERGIVILAPMIYRADRSALPEAERSDESASAIGIRGFKAAHVFDISQTEGEPLAKLPTIQGDPGIYRDRLETLIRAHGILIEYRTDLGTALGVSCCGKIGLRPGQPAAEEFATLVHEFAHELLHDKETRTGMSRKQRETEAEAVAYVVCHAIGLDTNTASSDYIQLYQGDRELLIKSLDVIQKTAALILEGIEVGT